MGDLREIRVRRLYAFEAAVEKGDWKNLPEDVAQSLHDRAVSKIQEMSEFDNKKAHFWVADNNIITGLKDISAKEAFEAVIAGKPLGESVVFYEVHQIKREALNDGLTPEKFIAKYDV